MIFFCSAILGKECLSNGSQFSEIAWLCQLRLRQSIYHWSWGWKAIHSSSVLGRSYLDTISPAKSHARLPQCVLSFFLLTAVSESWSSPSLTTSTCPWWAISRAFKWHRSAAYLSRFEENCKVMALYANLAPSELCSDQEIIHYCSLFVLEYWGSCRFYRKPVL